MKESRIHRSAQDKFLLGVCGGLAAHWGIRTNYLRAAWVGVTVICMLFPRMVVLPVGLYLVCYLLMGAPEDEERLWELLSQTIKEAVGKLAESRSREGEALKQDLLEKLSGMEALVAYIEERSPQILSEYRKRLEDKVKELLEGAAIDESRIAAETAIYADRICVDEELVRLKSHIAATRRELEAGGSVGRKLDFIAQELNREANTILSKSTDLAVSDRAIALKTEIEKVREQIQNIE